MPFSHEVNIRESDNLIGSSARNKSNPINKYQFIYHFVPHPTLKQRALLLSHNALFLYCMVIALFLGLFKLVPKVYPGILGYASNINVQDLLKSTNEKRKAAGLSELRLNPSLSKAAEKKAAHMFKNDYWAHVAPDGTEPWDFILSEDYDYLYAGENLAKNFSTSNDVVVAWMNSTSHKDNLLSPNYDEIGFAVVNGILDGYETTLVVQMFGRPRARSQIATVYEEEQLLESYKTTTEAVPESELAQVPNQYIEQQNFFRESAVLPVVDVASAARGISISLGLFVSLLLILDIWYSRRKGILKVNGHTLSHLFLLLLVIVGIWFVLKPGVVL